MVIVFKRLPPTPPSRAQAQALQRVQQNYGNTLKHSVSNRWFILLLLSYGLNAGAFYAISTLLNPIYLSYYDKQTETASRYAGLSGMLLILSGIVGSLLAGFVLDQSKAYNFFMTGYLPIGFEYGVEITYPQNEAISGSLLNIAAQISGIVITKVQEFLIFKHDKVLLSNIMICVVLGIGTIITGIIRSPLRRQEAQRGTGVLLDS
ncbi:unnamed protein product [Didymodactylos carnosus]|uniref:Uncharacterized protein n=1 Tax=Didymodactylos carnosus TaxID=1234261 RepID=A0A815HW23_9BILA|nr:unnamed protein product [Didymodactylos carnosus]CAF1357091.1 unnamed protein product [Didymodactylos carnosus]CAF3969211.1 unnamed protein product [Didymodactylos carnosus]CAF4231534.1 unnamed protein product [Didymodactylos carnosus]